MKQVLKRFMTLALVAAMIAAVCPAIMPTASAAETVLETAAEGYLGLLVSYDGGIWQENEYNGYTGGVSTAAVAGCSGSSFAPASGKLTLKNDTTQPATLSFDYRVQLNNGTITINGTNILSNGSFSVSMSAGSSVDVDLLSSDLETSHTGIVLYNMSFTAEEDVTVTFAEPSHGTYFVDNVRIDEQTEYTNPFGTTYDVIANPAPGYTFLGWFTDGDFTCLSTDATTSLLLTCDCTVYPYFFYENTLQFKVGTRTCTDLNEADSWASSHGNEPIILMGDGTLPAGTYNISKGNTLLIPCSGNFELYTTDPESVAELPNSTNTYPFRTLTLAPGAVLNINGTLSLAGKQNMQQPCIGSTVGPFGFIKLEAQGETKSQIVVQNGGKLYCWGYITGGGEVKARSGAVVYEPFQVMDFRGGNALMNMMTSASVQGVFPVSQYYVQNIESRITFEYGAREFVRCITDAGKDYGFPPTPALVPFVAPEGANALFQMNSGCTFSKYYDAPNDRLCYEVNGDCSINSISMTFLGGTENAVTLNSAEFVMPLNGNFDVDVQSGTLTINQDMYVQPGATISIDEGALMYIPCVEDPDNPGETRPISVIIYDSDDWGNYCGPRNEPFCPIRYTPSEDANIRDVNTYEIEDATLDVNGQVTLDGYLWTTESGANVTSSEGTGKIMFNNDAPDAPTTTQQASQSGTNVSGTNVTMTSVQLNNNGTYTPTQGVTADTPFNCGSNGTWIDAPDYEVTYSVMGTEVDGGEVNSVLGTTLPTEVPRCPQDYTFLGWTTTEINGESTTRPEILTGFYQPEDDVVLRAVFVRTVKDFVKVSDATDFNGKYLIVDETSGRAFNTTSNVGSNGIDATSNYVAVTIDTSSTPYKIKHTTALETASVLIKPHGDNFTMQATGSEDGKYIGHNGGSSVGNNVNTSVYEITIAVANGVATIHNVPKTGTNVYIFKYNHSSNSNKFAFYKETSSSTRMPSIYRMGTDYYTTKLSCEHLNSSSVITAPGCLEGGYTTHTCSNCGYVWINQETEPVGHINGWEDVPATAEDQGYTIYTCTVCGNTYIGNYIPPLGYTYTVNFYVNGSRVSTDTEHYNSLHGYGLPVQKENPGANDIVIPTVEGYTFRGWSETQYVDEVTSATVHAGQYVPPQNDTNLYAIYTRSATAQEEYNGDYVKVANADPIYDGGKYLFVYEGDGYERAFNGAASDVNGGGDGNDTAVTITKAEGERNRITGTQAELAELTAGAVTIQYAFGSSAYHIVLPDGRYLGNAGSSAGNNVNAHTAYLNRISVNADGNAIITNVPDAGKSEYRLRYQDKFYFYKSTNDNPKVISLYYKDGTGSQLFYTTNPADCDHRDAECVVTHATCTAAGYWTWTCPKCGASWEEQNKENALGHAWDAGVVTPPSAANDWVGYTTYTCGRCNETQIGNRVGVDFQITYSVLGVTEEPITVNSNTGVTLPTPSQTVIGYEFVGWSEEAIPTETTVATNLKKGLYKPTGDVTLYATYARYLNSTQNERDYIRVNLDSNFASGGRVLIVCENYDGNGNAIAFNGDYINPNNSNNGVWGPENYISVTIVEDNGYTVIHPNSQLTAAEVAVKPIAGTPYFTMQLHNNKYIGSTGSSTGINQNSNPNYRTSMTLDEFNSAIIENVDGKNHYRFLYNSGESSDRFGFYTAKDDSTHHAVALYAKEGTQFLMYYTTDPAEHTHTYELFDQTPATCTAAGEETYGCGCGASYTVTVAALGHDMVRTGGTAATCTAAGSAIFTCSRCGVTDTQTLPALGHSDSDNDGECDECFEPMPRLASAQLALNEDIDVVYKAILPEGFYSASVSFTIGSDAPVTVSTYTYDSATGTYNFVCEGLTPQRMGDSISATLTVSADNADGETQTYTDTQASYSVRQYCVNKLADTDHPISTELRALLSDTLAYGAAAQTYVTYKTNALVTAGVTGASYSNRAVPTGLGASFSGTADANTYWTSAGLTLRNNVAMTFSFAAKSLDGLTVRVTLDGVTTELTEFATVRTGVYQATFAGLGADDFAKTVTASFYRNGDKVGNTVSYSVNAYACAKQNDSNTALAALVKALYNYGASAAAYAAANAG